MLQKSYAFVKRKGEYMKFIHLSDLHIGKKINEFSMIEDQKYILKQILSIVSQEQVDCVLLAGDIYDKPVPSAEAVQVLDKFLTALADQNISVFIISGNHDSAERLAFGAKLMSSRGIYLASLYEKNAKAICLSDSYGEVWFYLLPFIKPATIRHALSKEIGSYQDAVRVAVEHMDVDSKRRNILVSHQFVMGASRCESEQVSIGGLDQVDVSIFDSFDYVAMGHIHSPQYVGRETVRYCGTPLKYSFSEVSQKKSVTIVEMKEKGNIMIREVCLNPLRDMKKIRGTYLEVTSLSFYQEMNTEDYIQITLTDEEDILDGLQKLRIIYPNIMRLEYDNKRTRESQLLEIDRMIEQKSKIQLFEEFYRMQNNQPMSEPQKEFVEKLICEIQENLM